MFDKKEIELIRNQLPPRYRELISKKTELSIPTIARFFGSVPIRQHNAETIYDAALEIIQEHQERMEERKLKIRKLMTKEEQQSLNI